MLQQFINEFVQRFHDPETHRAVFTAALGWLIVTIRTIEQAWMLRR